MLLLAVVSSFSKLYETRLLGTMNTIDSKQAAIFIAVFSVIALLVNSTQGFGNTWKTPTDPTPVSSPIQNPAPVQQAAQNATAEHARFLAQYVSGSFTRQAGGRRIAIVVATEDRKQDSAVTVALAHKFQGASVQVSSSFFTEKFISDGLFNDALSGSSELLRKLDLANSVDVLVLAKENVVYSQNAALDNVTTATMQIEITVVPVSGTGVSQTWAFTAYGPGFSKEVARNAATDRLIKQIAADNKMLLD
jgi:hypothetical protein